MKLAVCLRPRHTLKVSEESRKHFNTTILKTGEELQAFFREHCSNVSRRDIEYTILLVDGVGRYGDYGDEWVIMAEEPNLPSIIINTSDVVWALANNHLPGMLTRVWTNNSPQR